MSWAYQVPGGHYGTCLPAHQVRHSVPLSGKQEKALHLPLPPHYHIDRTARARIPEPSLPLRLYIKIGLVSHSHEWEPVETALSRYWLRSPAATLLQSRTGGSGEGMYIRNRISVRDRTVGLKSPTCFFDRALLTLSLSLNRLIAAWTSRHVRASNGVTHMLNGREFHSSMWMRTSRIPVRQTCLARRPHVAFHI